MIAVPGDDPRAVVRATRAALDGTGPAIALGAGGGRAGRGAGPVGRGEAGGVGASTPGAGPGAPSDGVGIPGGHVAAIVTTSGSTGYPKSVVLGRDALRASAAATAERIGEGAWLLALPPGYVAGLQVIVRALLAGGEPEVLDPSFGPAAFVDAAAAVARAGRPTYVSLVPAQLARLLGAADDPPVAAALRSFAAILVGGQTLAPALRDRAAALGARVVRTYGSSETSGGCVYDGVPLAGVGVRIAAGEVLLSGPMLADGYLGDPGRTAAAFLPDASGIRWYRTGDAGVFEQGVLRVTGRLDNVIVSGGVNVSLDRVERAVRGIPGLEEAVVVGVRDERWGEAPVLVLPGDGTPEDAALLERARAVVGSELGAPARPRDVLRVGALAPLASGKPDRAAMRRIAQG